MLRNILIFWAIGLLPVVAAAKICVENRAAFDIGSGTTKLVVAQVNFCHQKVEKILLERNMPVGYQDDLEKSKSGIFSPKIMKEGMEVLKSLKEMALFFKPKKFRAVATSAFRKAQNGSQLVKEIESKLKLRY